MSWKVYPGVDWSVCKFASVQETTPILPFGEKHASARYVMFERSESFGVAFDSHTQVVRSEAESSSSPGHPLRFRPELKVSLIYECVSRRFCRYCCFYARHYY